MHLHACIQEQSGFAVGGVRILRILLPLLPPILKPGLNASRRQADAPSELCPQLLRKEVGRVAYKAERSGACGSQVERARSERIRTGYGIGLFWKTASSTASCSAVNCCRWGACSLP